MRITGIQRSATLVRIWRVILVAAILAACGVPAAAATARSLPRGPAGLAFYNPPHRLLSGPHGSVIWARPIRSPLSAAGRSYLVLYRSVGAGGRPIAVSGTVDMPAGRPPRGGWPVISWTHGTVGIADACAPSRNPTAGINAYAFAEFNAWLRSGYVLARTDYEGLGTPGAHPYLVGPSEGRSAIDIVRAARALSPRVSRRWIVAGHSQGGQAALFAAALGPSWAPELSLRGVAAFAPASHIALIVSALPVLNAPSPLSSTLALVAVGAAAVDPSLALDRLLSDRALALLPLIERDCALQLGGSSAFGALAPAQVVRPGPDLARLGRILGSANPALTITVPVLVVQGLTDTTVSPALTNELVAELRMRHDALTYLTFPGVEHVGILNAGAAAAASFFAHRL